MTVICIIHLEIRNCLDFCIGQSVGDFCKENYVEKADIIVMITIANMKFSCAVRLLWKFLCLL